MFAAVVEALSVRDRVSAGSMTSFAAVVVALSDRDRVSAGRSTIFSCSCRNSVCQAYGL